MTEQAVGVEGVTPGLLASLRERWKAERVEVESELHACDAELMKWQVRERRKRLASLHPILMGKIYFPQWLTRESPPVHF